MAHPSRLQGWVLPLDFKAVCRNLWSNVLYLITRATLFKCLHSHLALRHSHQMVQGLVVPPSLPLILEGQGAFRHPNLAAHHPHLVTQDPLLMGPHQLLVDPQRRLDLQGPEECTLTE